MGETVFAHAISAYAMRKLQRAVRQVKQLNEAYDRYHEALRQDPCDLNALFDLEKAVAFTLHRDRFEYRRSAPPKPPPPQQR